LIGARLKGFVILLGQLTLPMMRWVTYLLFCILFLGAEVRAAFPIAPVPEPAPKEHVGLKEIKKLIKKMPQDNVGSVATVDKNIPGLLSFVFAIGGILMMFIPPIVLLFPLLEIAAIVLGVIGMGRRPRGLAIAGFVIGVSAILLLLFLFLVLAVLFNSMLK
jgi:hypothetical protein